MKNLLLLVIILISPVIVFAHPGRTDSSGCHTCRTNCASWGLSSGEYHCHNQPAVKAIEEPFYEAPTPVITKIPTFIPKKLVPKSRSKKPTITKSPAKTTTFTCNCARTCTKITSCKEAYYQLNTCGCSVRDSDNDGIPCENICK